MFISQRTIPCAIRLVGQLHLLGFQSSKDPHQLLPTSLSIRDMIEIDGILHLGWDYPLSCISQVMIGLTLTIYVPKPESLDLLKDLRRVICS